MNRFIARLHALPRRTKIGAALVGGCAVLLAAALASVLPVDRGPHPEAVTATVTACDLSQRGAAQVSYTVTNGDQTTHGYRVRLTVTDGSATIGSGTGLVNHVAAGATSTARALVPVGAGGPAATCSASAEVFDGDIGRHSAG